MRKTLVFFVLVLAGAWPRPSLAQCPGISACVYNKGCPKGSTQVKPGQTIQQAIDAAPYTSATLCVLPGTYTGLPGTTTELINFHGKPINLVSSGGPGVTFLDGGGVRQVVIFASAEGKDSILNGFTIRNGKAGYGAGIYIKESSPTIRNSILSANSATGTYGRGGGIGVMGVQAHPSINCTQFLRNTSSYEGGGLESTDSANPYLRSDLFEGNTARYGAAIGVHISGRLDLGWTQLLANQASVDGGGMHVGVPYGNVLVRQVWFKGNTAVSNGGGMWVAAGLAEVINSTFDGNQAAEGGGIAGGYGSMVDVASTLFIRNKTTNLSSATLVNAQGSNTSVVNHYNGFFGNTGAPNYKNTYGDKGVVLLPSFGGSCCPDPGSPAINAGIPDDPHFNDPDGSRNDMGACGGPALSTFGPMK